MIALARRFDLWTRTRPSWWWPASLFALGVAVWAASLVLQPVGETSFFRGSRLGEDCAFLVQTGQPCPNCGMTRSFLWAARFDLIRSFQYNPAGATLFWWITSGAVVGGVRLVRRDAKALRLPWQLIVGWALFWVVGLFLIPYIARLAGYNPLP